MHLSARPVWHVRKTRFFLSWNQATGNEEEQGGREEGEEPWLSLSLKSAGDGGVGKNNQAARKKGEGEQWLIFHLRALDVEEEEEE